MSIQYRERTLPFDVYNADYTQFQDYHHSFNVAPRTSLLRFTISPGQHIFNNLDYSNLMMNDPRYIPLEQSVFLATGKKDGKLLPRHNICNIHFFWK